MKINNLFKQLLWSASLMSAACTAADDSTFDGGDAVPRMAAADGSCASPGADACGGQSPDGCWCDENCELYGDCCDDKVDVCDAPDSCADACGEQSGSCWCDENCELYGDCCDDYVAECVAPPAPTCADACGEQAAAGCWCDDQCEDYGDCCPDKVDQCDLVACTKDAMVCPDGTVLGREGPDCEFPACPCSTNDECNPGQTCNPLLGECESAPGCELILCGPGTACVEDEFGAGSCQPLVACTEDALLCPDGTVLGREGPDCEFPACPCSTNDECNPGQTCNPLLGECESAPGCELILCGPGTACVEDEFGAGSCQPTCGGLGCPECETDDDCGAGEVCDPCPSICDPDEPFCPTVCGPATCREPYGPGCELIDCAPGFACIETLGAGSCVPTPIGCEHVTCPEGFECNEYDGVGECDPLVACPEDAMICPDGSVVVREGPDCEFPPCGPAGECDTDADCASGEICHLPTWTCPPDAPNGFCLPGYPSDGPKFCIPE